MKNIFYLSVLFLTAAIFYACTPKSWEQAQTAYSSGDIYNAVKLTASTLKEKSNYKDAVDFLSNILPASYNDLSQKAKSYEARNDWDNAVSAYLTITNISDVVKTIPPQLDENTNAIIKFETNDVSSELDNALNKAAQLHYNAGLNLENSSRSKDAAKEYSKVLEYIPDYKDASERYNNMRRAAITRVVIMPFENKSGKEQFGELGENVSDQCISELMSDSENLEFGEIVIRDRLYELMAENNLGDVKQLDEKTSSKAGKVLGIHSFIFGKVTAVSINTPPETNSDVEQTAYVMGLTNNKTHTKSAVVTVTTRKASATVKCTYQIVDVAKGTIVKSGTVEGIEEYVITFGRFRGDKDALSKKYIDLCNKEEEYPPSRDVLVTKALEKLSQKLSSEIAGYFK